jgi:hypothetical protein
MVKTGDEATTKLVSPAGKVTDAKLKSKEYKKTPESPLAAKSGKSRTFGILIFFIIPTIPNVKDAVTNLNVMSETGL